MPHYFPSRTPLLFGPRKPSTPGVPTWPTCKQAIHHHPVPRRHHLYESHLFRILLLRRLRLPIPLTASHCRCRRAFDPYGDHRAACAQSGILRNRAGPLERATARMCREAGARVTTNTLLTNLNIEHSTRPDDRRIEVIANGLTLWGGTQLAIDTTLVSPLTRDGQPRSAPGDLQGPRCRMRGGGRNGPTRNSSGAVAADLWCSELKRADGVKKHPCLSNYWPEPKHDKPHRFCKHP